MLGLKSRACFLLLALAPLAVACHAERPEAESRGKLAVTSPLMKPTELTREYVAQIHAIKHIELRALERGYLQDVFVDEGQNVPAHQKMFQIMPLIYQAEVQKAQAEAERTTIELKTTRTLAEKNIVSPNELSLAKAKNDRATAELSLATTHKGLTEIRAPFSGVMGRFHARQGSLIAEGDLLTTLSDNSTMWVYFNVAEAEYLKLKTETGTEKPPVKLRMANGKVFDQPGVVETVEADFDNETGTIAFRAAFPNPKGLLRHGETGKVMMSVPLKSALVIPQKATFDVLDRKFVFVVDEKNVVHSRAIEVLAELPQVFVVKSGLDEHDHILLEGLRKVHEGGEIEPEFEKPEEVLSHLEVPSE